MKKSFLTLYTTPSLLIFLVFSYLLLGCFSHSSQYNITTKTPPPISKKKSHRNGQEKKKMKKKSLCTFWFCFFLSPFLVGYMSGKLLLRFSFPFCCCCWLVEICRLRYFGSYPASLGGRWRPTFTIYQRHQDFCWPSSFRRLCCAATGSQLEHQLSKDDKNLNETKYNSKCLC